VKIWEQNNAKRVLGCRQMRSRTVLRGPVMEKEIFLACGEGTGLADITSFTAFV